MEVAKLSAPPNLQVRSVSCNESAIKRWLSSELEETLFSLTHEVFMTRTLSPFAYKQLQLVYQQREKKTTTGYKIKQAENKISAIEGSTMFNCPITVSSSSSSSQ